MKAFRGVGRFFEALYERGGWLLFPRPALIVLAALVVAGIACFAYLVAGRYGTPFVVASKIGLGGLSSWPGASRSSPPHELAHGLTMACFGRRVDRAGLKAVFIFPYVFVDTSEAWFEPRRHRIAVSAAGPASDFTLGGLFARAAAGRRGHAARRVLPARVRGLRRRAFNLNPFLDRDGYHILVDVLREPGLRRAGAGAVRAPPARRPARDATTARWRVLRRRRRSGRSSAPGSRS